MRFISALSKERHTKYKDINKGELKVCEHIIGPETAGDYLRREDVLNLLNKNSITKKITLSDGVSIYDAVKNLPAITIPGLYGWKCSLCDEHVYVNRKSDVNRYLYPCCPNCSAKMKKGE